MPTLLYFAVAPARPAPADDPATNDTKRYTVDRPLNFIMSVNVITMVWSLYLFLANLFAICRMCAHSHRRSSAQQCQLSCILRWLRTPFLIPFCRCCNVPSSL